ncbi:MAG: L-histidine N(alpha)-methyltransferase, partial [Bacteroidota bacterium]
QTMASRASIQVRENTLSPFAQDVLDGLSVSPKQLSSKWFYDEHGDALFQAIMASPEYYLTDAELSIFQTCAGRLHTQLGATAIDLIELGAGDGTKTKFLIDGLREAGTDIRYIPVDISANALEGLGQSAAVWWPDQDFIPLEGEYFQALESLPAGEKDRKRLLLFPGANIGNFPMDQARRFLRELRMFLRRGDFLLIGFDLKKDPAQVLAAYNDPGGHTAAFNLNLLSRINRELGADFDLNYWKHWETYDPGTGAARSQIVSTQEQVVRVEKLNRAFSFRAWEAISVEVSQKYGLHEIERLAGATGYRFVEHFQDEHGWFSDSLWRA